MQHTRPANLVTEAERYLTAVAAFRAEGYEPRWWPEPGARSLRRRIEISDRRDPHEPISRRSE